MSSNVVFFFLTAFLATSTFGQAPSPSPAPAPSPTATPPSPVSSTGSPTISPTTSTFDQAPSYSPTASPKNSPAPVYSPNATPPASVSPSGSRTISSAASGPADDSYDVPNDNSADDGFDDIFGNEAPASSPIHKSSAASLRVV